MIGFLQGTIRFIRGDHFIVETGGVGYKVLTPLSLIVAVKEGESVSLFIHTHVREDQFTLYGFQKEEELFVFEKLLSVSGIGPKSALSMLSTNSPSLIANAIEGGDATSLSRTPGIGKKTAEKIIIELKGKLSHLVGKGESKELEEVRLALEALGYSNKEIHEALKKVDTDNKTTSSIIKDALLQLH